MKFIKSWISLPLLRNTVTNNLLPVKASLLLFGGFLLLSFISIASFVLTWVVFFLSAFLLTTIYAPMIQGYVSDKTESTYVKTLPLSTGTVWFTQYIAGFLLISTTLIIQVFCLYVREYFFGSESYASTRLFVATFILVFIYYSISFFVVCISGKRIGQFILTLAFYFMPALFYMGLIYVGNTFIITNIASIDLQNIMLTLPVWSGLEFVFHGNQWSLLMVHIGIGILFFVGGYFAFKHRPLEKTENIILYSSMSYIIRFIIVITATMILYLLFIYGGNISYAYDQRGVALSYTLYSVIAIVFALGLELVFKSERIYCTIATYIPVIIISIIGSYYISSWNYEGVKQDIKDSSIIEMGATLIIDGYWEEQAYFNLTPEIYDSLIQQIQNQPNNLYSSVPSQGNYVSLRVYGNERNTVDSFDIVGLTHYYMAEEVFKELFNNNHQELLKSSITAQFSLNYIENKDSTYWVIGTMDEEIYSVVSNEDMDDIIDILLQHPLSYEELFSDSVNDEPMYWVQYLGYYIRSIPSIDEIEDIIHKQENIEKANILSQLKQQAEREFILPVSTVDLHNTMTLEGVNLIASNRIAAFDDIISTTKVTDNEVHFNMTMYFFYHTDVGEDVRMYKVEIIYELDGDTIVSQKLVEKGEFYDGYLVE